MAKAWSILMAARFMVPLAEPACPEGGACSVPHEDTFDEVNMLQEKRLLVKASSKSSEASNSSKASTEDSSDCSEDLDVAYGSNDKHKVDVYWPADATLKPSAGWTAVLILPGLGSDRKGWKGFCTKYMVPTGRLCVAADYRQGDAYRNDDVFDLATWFYAEAHRWDVDTTKIVLGGVSQGGLTINNVIWDKKKAKELLKKPPKVHAVMLLSGTWNGHQNKARKAKYVPGFTFIMTSDNDGKVPGKYSKNLYTELDKKTDDVKFAEIHGGGHSIWYTRKEEWYAEIFAFLDEVLPVDNYS